ncbi:MAG: aldo/keto reductase [Phototrophicales bacterium]|nr:MAG: aldo/keto reductase [Phototrophicales bacterium]
MKYNKLGNSGLLVSELALGTMLFGGTESRDTPEADAIRMIHQYIDYGGNHIDTANVYTGGRSEEIIGNAIKGKRDGLVIATKVRFSTGKGRNEEGLSRYHIMKAVEHSLKKLQIETIDLYYMHAWDALTPIEESLRAFDDLVTAGKVRYIGVSNFKAWQVMKALGISEAHGWAKFVAGQYQYSLVVRGIEYEFSDLCEREGIGIVPWGALGGGFLSGKYKRGERPQTGRISIMPDHTEEAWHRRDTEHNWNIIDAVGKIADERGISYSQVALAWVKAQPLVCSIILGARTLDQFEDNMKVVDIHLTDEELTWLNEASALPDLYPYRMIEAYGRKLG